MKVMLMIAAMLGVTMLGSCATYATGYPPGDYYFYEWGYEGGGGKGQYRSSGGGRSEPGNEAGMYPARGGASSGGGPSRGGEAGSR